MRSIAGGARGFGFPCGADAREEIRSGRRVFGDRALVERPVVADGGSADEDRRRARGVANGGRQAASRLHAAVEHTLLVGRRPAFGGDRFAREIDDRAGAVDDGRPRTRVTIRRPRHVGTSRTSSTFRTPRTLRTSRTAGENDDVMPVARERRGEGSAQESGAAGDHDSHGGSPRADALDRLRGPELTN